MMATSKNTLPPAVGSRRTSRSGRPVVIVNGREVARLIEMSSRVADLTGLRFGMLTVVSFNRSENNSFWNCVCDCAQVSVVRGSHLIDGHVKSCGCTGRINSVHFGKNKTASSTPEHGVWSSMISRCHRPNSTGFHNYGGRGITVCDRWLFSFANFIDDMGFRPSPVHSIERINNNVGYCPENCKWATQK